MKYAYPAIFTEEDNQILVEVPDLRGVFTFGDSVAEALYMAQDAIEMWLCDAEDKHEIIPKPSSIKEISKSYEDENRFVSMVAADTDTYRRQVDTRSVRKTLSIPSWLNYQAEKANAPFSQILQQSLKAYLNINER
jgi:predicted RNase H-like HicB family nuclease